MANRPRLPNVDPEDLAKLANQYPGSRTSEGTSAGDAGAGSSPAGTSGPSLSASASSRAGASPTTADARSAGGGSAGGGSGTGGSRPGDAAPAPRKSGSWTAAVLTFLFALIAVVAAVVAIGAPSYRAEIHALLTKYAKPRLNDDTIAILSGYDTRRLEVTYEGLDQRIERLNQALARIGATQGMTSDDARALMFRDDLAEKLDAVTATVDTLAGTAESQSRRIADLGTDMTGLIGELRSELQERAATIQGAVDVVREAVDATRTDLAALSERVAAAEGDAEQQAALSVEMAARFDTIEARLGTLVTDFNGLLDLNDQIAQAVATFKNENMPVLAVIQLRDAVNRSEPYVPELAFAQRVLDGAPGIKEALGKLTASAPNGITGIPVLRRDLRLIANNLGSFVSKVESWSDRVGSWFNMMVGASTVPEARRGGGIVAAIATIDEALDRGDLELVIREGAALQSELRSAAFADWLGAVVERIEVTDAVRKLEAVVYARSTAAGNTQGASKVQ
jgi:hypothetical protein